MKSGYITELNLFVKRAIISFKEYFYSMVKYSGMTKIKSAKQLPQSNIRTSVGLPK